MTQYGSYVTEVTVIDGVVAGVVCTALGSRPIVEIRWYQRYDDESEERIMTGVTQTNTSNADGTFDTVSTLEYTVGDDSVSSIRCETNGQHVAESRETLAYLIFKCKYSWYLKM